MINFKVYPASSVGKNFRSNVFRKRSSSSAKIRRPYPYYIFRRQRTKSENTDNSGAPGIEVVQMEITSTNQHEISMDTQPQTHSVMPHFHHACSNPQFNKIKTVQLKKSKSFDDLQRDATPTDDNKSYHELEFMVKISDRIQKLKLQIE